MPSIVAVRSRIRSVVECGAGAARSPDIVVLGVDGIPYELATAAWPRARTERMRSVFPTTSTAGWLSSLCGLDVGSHGVPGVVLRLPGAGERPVDLFAFRGELGCPEVGNAFSDAADLGYAPLALLGDLAPYDCAWRDLLLRHAERMTGSRFFTAPVTEPDPLALGRRVLCSLTACLAATAPSPPRLVWCFVEVDRRVHVRGYDDYVAAFLGALDDVAATLAERGVVVLAHSDHGLTRTRHDAEIERLLVRVEREGRCAIGGAGRTRWLYPRPGGHDELVALVRAGLPSSVRVLAADELFPADSLARARVGDIVLLAEGERFVTSAGHDFDHGSLSAAELDVPFSEWRA